MSVGVVRSPHRGYKAEFDVTSFITVFTVEVTFCVCSVLILIKMILRSAFCIFMLFILIEGDTKTSGISQFWTDDIKVFDQIYGKTSDKELYGATLPPTIRFDIDSKNPITIAASEKKERYLPNGRNILDSDFYPYDYGDRYAKLFSKSLSSESKPSSALQFISFSDFKPISKSTDPETYRYLKNLEKMTEKKNEKRYKNHKTGINSEEDEAYKSIQDILDAHEANSADSNEDEDRPKPKSKDSFRYSRNRNRSKVRSITGNSIKSRCVSSRCRSKPTYIRPYIRKIKHYTYTRR